MRNAGKSSVVNAVTGQNLVIVSNVKGTTTDPVKKAMELLPLGPVVIIDTPGLDDEGELGLMRVQKARGILAQTDIAILVVDASIGMQAQDKELIADFVARKKPYLIVYNKSDLLSERPQAAENEIYVSANTGENIAALKEKIGALAPKTAPRYVVRDLLEEGDLVILVTPIDEAAPKGRLILPQQMTIRDILDGHGVPVVCQEDELKTVLTSLSKKPKMVITDSQAFGRVSADTPEGIALTSFSILMARYKGDLKALVSGASMLSRLQEGDKVLISEGCTHHRQCNDIGTVKLPRLIEKFSGVKPDFHFTSGGEYPEDLSSYRVIVHCGGCMLNEAEMSHRIEKAAAAGVPIVNYGIAIAHMNGILKRSVEIFPDIYELL